MGNDKERLGSAELALDLAERNAKAAECGSTVSDYIIRSLAVRS